MCTFYSCVPLFPACAQVPVLPSACPADRPRSPVNRWFVRRLRLTSGALHAAPTPSPWSALARGRTSHLRHDGRCGLSTSWGASCLALSNDGAAGATQPVRARRCPMMSLGHVQRVLCDDRCPRTAADGLTTQQRIILLPSRRSVRVIRCQVLPPKEPSRIFQSVCHHCPTCTCLR